MFILNYFGENKIKYITLRLKDSNEWGRILTNIFGFTISIIKDYESSNKPIKELYSKFKLFYKIPINLLNKNNLNFLDDLSNFDLTKIKNVTKLYDFLYR